MVESIFMCPVPAALPTVPDLDCPAAYGNIQAVVLQVRQGTPSFTESSIAILATWTPLLVAAGASGIRVIPATNFETTPGEPITEGGNDQTTYQGRPKLKGVGFSSASYTMDSVPHEFALAVKNMTVFSALASGRSKLRAYFLTDENYIICGSDFNGIEIFNHVVQDVKKGGGFKLGDNYPVTFGLDYGWSLSGAKTIKANFDVQSLVQFTD